MKNKLIVNICISVFSFVIIILLFLGFFYFGNFNYTETEYKVGYSVISELCDYYDRIDDNFFDYIKYRLNDKKSIDLLERDFSNEDADDIVLIKEVKNLKTYVAVKKFVHNSQKCILKASLIVYNNKIEFNDVDFILVVRTYNFGHKKEIFLTVNYGGEKSELIKII